MVKKILSGVLLAVISFFINLTGAFAEEQPYFKAPMDVAGTGCPQYSVTVTGDGTDTLTIMFDQYDAADPPSSAASGLKRSSCNFAVPVHVPAGFQVSHLTADWRGYSEGETELTRQYFLADQPTSQITKITTFYEYNGIDFFEQDSLDPSHYTTCQRQARDVMLRINSEVDTKGSDSYIAVDTIDKALVFDLNWQECKDPVLPPILWLLLRSSP
ncbi:MAG: DUF4360 domain-containing protein [Candidatus Electrothrix sp. ATG2]|nr:DUF4360 domain-containing protein [Candidatus Electrothrix sp. ATG2]